MKCFYKFLAFLLYWPFLALIAITGYEIWQSVRQNGYRPPLQAWILMAVILSAHADTLVWNANPETNIVAYRVVWNGASSLTTFTNMNLGTLSGTNIFAVSAINSANREGVPGTLTYIVPPVALSTGTTGSTKKKKGRWF